MLGKNYATISQVKQNSKFAALRIKGWTIDTGQNENDLGLLVGFARPNRDPIRHDASQYGSLAECGEVQILV